MVVYQDNACDFVVAIAGTLLQPELLFEILMLDISGFCRCPRFQAHLLDQTQIKDFGIVRHFRCPVCIRLKMVTWEVRTLIAEIKLSFRDTPVDITRFVPVKKIRFPCFFTAPFAYRLLKWYAKVPGNLCP